MMTVTIWFLNSKLTSLPIQWSSEVVKDPLSKSSPVCQSHLSPGRQETKVSGGLRCRLSAFTVVPEQLQWYLSSSGSREGEEVIECLAPV